MTRTLEYVSLLRLKWNMLWMKKSASKCAWNGRNFLLVSCLQQRCLINWSFYENKPITKRSSLLSSVEYSVCYCYIMESIAVKRIWSSMAIFILGVLYVRPCHVGSLKKITDLACNGMIISNELWFWLVFNKKLLKCPMFHKDKFSTEQRMFALIVF